MHLDDKAINDVEELEEEVKFERIKLSFRQILAILIPYISAKLTQQLVIVLPLVLYLIFFQSVILKRSLEGALVIALGVALVIFGLAFFIEGVRLGLIPFAERIGSGLARRATLPVVLAFAFLLGAGATLAEPAVAVVRSAGSWIDPKTSSLLYFILNQRPIILVLAIAAGVGSAALLGILRVILDWKIIKLLVPLTAIALILTFISVLNPQTVALAGLAWDTGGLIVGPITLPLILAVGFGLAMSAGRADVGKAGFGIAGMCALLPVITIMLSGLIVHFSGFASESAGAPVKATSSSIPGVSSAFVSAALTASLALPLILFLYLVLAFIIRSPLANREEIFLGVSFALIGIFLLNGGIILGLSYLGSQTGEVLPTAFHPPEGSLFGSIAGRAITIAFAFVLGYVATICEPAFNALAIQVEEITIGAIKKTLIIHTVSAGVAVGAALGAFKLISNLPLAYFIIPIYILLIFFSLRSTDEFVSIAWDSGACTTGSITVPLVIAIGLSLGSTLGVIEAFGIIALGTALPIAAVLWLGFVAKPSRPSNSLEEKPYG